MLLADSDFNPIGFVILIGGLGMWWLIFKGLRAVSRATPAPIKDAVATTVGLGIKAAGNKLLK